MSYEHDMTYEICKLLSVFDFLRLIDASARSFFLNIWINSDFHTLECLESTVSCLERAVY